MRVSLHETPVHEGPGVSLVAVGQDVLGPSLGPATGLPLPPRGKASAATAPQAGADEGVDDGLGPQIEGPGQPPVAATDDVILDVLGINEATVGQNPSSLPPIEGDGLDVGEGLLSLPVEEPLDDASLEKGDAKELLGVLRPHLAVEKARGMDRDEGASLAKTLTARADQIEVRLEIDPHLAGRLGQGPMDVGTAHGQTAGTATEGEAKGWPTPLPEGATEGLQGVEGRHGNRSLSRISPRRPADLP